MLSQIFTLGLMILFRGLASTPGPRLRSVDQGVLPARSPSRLQFGCPRWWRPAARWPPPRHLWFLRSTRLGAALEATAADKEAAALMGIDARRCSRWLGLGAACAGWPGLLSTTFPLPEWGELILMASCWWPWRFGSVAGAFWAASWWGVEVVAASSGPGLQAGPGLSLYLLVVWLRPRADGKA